MITANIIFNNKKNESIPSKIKNKTMIPTLTTFIQHNIGNPSHNNHK